MYSHEIEELLKIKQNVITISEYLKIISTSPQINHIKYNDDCYEIETDDKYKFKIKVRNKS